MPGIEDLKRVAKVEFVDVVKSVQSMVIFSLATFSVGPLEETISGLTAFTHVAAWYLPSIGFIGLIPAANAIFSNGLLAKFCP